MSRRARQHEIARLLGEHRVSSQGDLVELLTDAGIEATQATVSRDLDALGAVKVRVGGGELMYAIPELASEQIAPREHLGRVLSEWVAQVRHSGNIVVIKTPPGSAHVVASAIDRSGLDEIVGTVAGDDSIFVLADESFGGAALSALIADYAGLS
jgi:transcriptional regulator of arginine metabolism